VELASQQTAEVGEVVLAKPHRCAVHAPSDRRARSCRTFGAGLEAIGQVVHPDPYTAIQNALQFYAPDDIVISTFPETRSGWLRADLIGRVEASTGKPVEHVVTEEEG